MRNPETTEMNNELFELCMRNGCVPYRLGYTHNNHTVNRRTREKYSPERAYIQTMMMMKTAGCFKNITADWMKNVRSRITAHRALHLQTDNKNTIKWNINDTQHIEIYVYVDYSIGSELQQERIKETITQAKMRSMQFNFDIKAWLNVSIMVLFVR